MAQSIPEDTIHRVKNTANIVDIIGERLALKKAGRNYIGLCPFHAEKTPSFSVSPEKQIFYCFGCHTGGTVFSFLMQQDGLSFPEAVRVVGRKYGIDIPDEKLSTARKQQLSEKEKLYKLNEKAITFFRQTLYDPRVGQKAMSYLLARGMTRKVMDSHSLGYSPSLWDALVRFFEDLKIPLTLVAKTGLVVPRKDGNGFYDRFRDRVMFPIFNQTGQVIAFGGRVMGEQMPKYLNSPESIVFNKRRSLYGIEKARTAARNKGKVFVVEGYFDVLALHLYGIDNAVATLGTALTDDHVQLLKSMVGPNGLVILVYDSDRAGISAARKSIPVFEHGYMDARILVLPRGEDPDSYIREFGPEAFQKAADAALGMIPFLLDTLINEFGLSIEGKVKIVAAMQEPLASVHDTVARTLYIQNVSERLDIAESVVMEKVRQTIAAVTAKQNPNQSDRRRDTFSRLSDTKRIEQQMIVLMLRNPAVIRDIVERRLVDYFEDEQLKTIAAIIVAEYGRGHTGESRVADLITMMDDDENRNLITRLAMMDMHWDREGCERLLKQFEMRCRRQTTKDLQVQIEEAEKNKDYNLLNRLLRQKQQQAEIGTTHSKVAGG